MTTTTTPTPTPPTLRFHERMHQLRRSVATALGVRLSTVVEVFQLAMRDNALGDFYASSCYPSPPDASADATTTTTTIGGVCPLLRARLLALTRAHLQREEEAEAEEEAAEVGRRLLLQKKKKQQPKKGGGGGRRATTTTKLALKK